MLATTFAALSLAGVALVIFDLKSYESSMSVDLLTQADIVGTATGPALDFQDEKVARDGEAAGLTVVMDRCLKVDHSLLVSGS